MTAPSLAPVPRWTQGWLSGPPNSGHPVQYFRGQRLGLPAHGPGSVGSFPARIAALVVDWLPAYLVAVLFTENPATSALALFAAYTTVWVAVAGRTPGHAATGLRVARLDGGRPGVDAAVIRTVLLCLVIPPAVYNVDGRGWHDRAAGTIVLRTR